MIKPRPLRPGDRVAVVSLASPFERGEFEAGIDELRLLGFDPVYDESVFARRNYVSGDDTVRAAALRRALTDSGVTGVIGARGGYGSVQVLPLIDLAEVLTARKVFVGYSDLTSLLIAFGKAGLVCFHGPMLAGRLAKGESGYDRDTFLRAVGERAPLGELRPPGLESIRNGDRRGPLLGGTLTQIVASLGTPWAFDPPVGHVLFIEDVGERPYRLDRMLTQLRLAGLLQRASAVLVGELPGCDEPGGPAGRAVVAEVLRDFPGPVAIGFPSGHTAGPALTLPLGVQTRVVCGPDGAAVVIEEAAVD
jgi:muramoyltetrapeptide carboxypeptidase